MENSLFIFPLVNANRRAVDEDAYLSRCHTRVITLNPISIISPSLNFKKKETALQRLTETFVGVVSCGAGPRSIVVKWKTFLAVATGCVVLTTADETRSSAIFRRTWHTLGSVTVALAPNYLNKGTLDYILQQNTRD